MIVEHYTVTLHSTPAYRRRMMAKRRALRRRRIMAAIMAVAATAMMAVAGIMIADSFHANPVYAMTSDDIPVVEPCPIQPEDVTPITIVSEAPNIITVVDENQTTEQVTDPAAANTVPEETVTNTVPDTAPEETVTDTAPETTEATEPVQEYADETIEPASCGMNDDQIYELALMCVAEAEGEPEYGQRLVIDTALNRMDDASWPDEIIAVIHQAHQFSSFENGRAARCTVTDYFINLVKEELENRTDYSVFYFTAGHYGKYGTPLFRVGNHYFSGK